MIRFPVLIANKQLCFSGQTRSGVRKEKYEIRLRETSFCL